MKLPPPAPDGHPAPGDGEAAARVARLTALALGELSNAEAGALEAEIWRDADARREIENIRELAEQLTFAYASESPKTLTPAQHRAILERSHGLTGSDEKEARLTAYALGELRPAQAEVLSARLTDDRAATLELEAVGALAAKLRAAFADEQIPLLTLEQRQAIMAYGQERTWEPESLLPAPAASAPRSSRRPTPARPRPAVPPAVLAAPSAAPVPAPASARSRRWLRTAAVAAGFSAIGYLANTYHEPNTSVALQSSGPSPTAHPESEFFPPLPAAGSPDSPKLMALLDREKRRPAATATHASDSAIAKAEAESRSAPGVEAAGTAATASKSNAADRARATASEDASVPVSPPRRQPDASLLPPPRPALASAAGHRSGPDLATVLHSSLLDPDTEPLTGFLATADVATATVPIDLGRGGYDLIRQCLRDFGTLPPAALVRPEEIVNQFDYDVQPAPGQDFAVAVEAAACPWNESHHLVRVTVAAGAGEATRLPLRLTMFLRLAESPESERAQLLTWQGLQMLASRLQPQDSVSMVVWGHARGLVLPATGVAELENLREAPTRWHQGGASLGLTDWATAEQAMLSQAADNTRNLCLMVTDGPLDYSGPPLDEIARRLRSMGAEIAVAELGPLRPDSRTAMLADRAATPYHRADSGPEACRLLAQEALAGPEPLADEADLHVTFSPSALAAWRPIGFGAPSRSGDAATAPSGGSWAPGRQVTTLYEVVPASQPGAWSTTAVFAAPATSVDFAASAPPPKPAPPLSVQLRYRSPRTGLVQTITTDWTSSAGAWRTASPDFRLAAGAAAFALHLQKDHALINLPLARVSGWVRTAALDRDDFGLRREFAGMIDAVEKTRENSSARSE